MFFLSCSLFENKGICVEKDGGTISGMPYTSYECWDGKSEVSCYGDFYSGQNCADFCSGKSFCRIKN